MGRSQADGRAGTDELTESELDRRLLEFPNSVDSHLRMGNLRSKLGKDALARISYREAFRLAESQGVPVESVADFCRAQEVLAGYESLERSQRQARLTERGLPPDSWSPRFRQALEIAAGERRLFRPEPTDFEYPGLPAVQFFDPANFDWSAELEANTDEIRRELSEELRRGTTNFRPYVQDRSSVPEANLSLLQNHDWSVLPLCEQGWVSQNAVRRFPRTWAALQKAPLPAIYGWGPTVVFSLLKAGAHIPAHNGMFNTRLVCHLPLIVPSDCALRVGNDVRPWEEGELLIFDDTIEHEAWNNSDEDRIVLIFDIWRPELSETEREELVALFHA